MPSSENPALRVCFSARIILKRSKQHEKSLRTHALEQKNAQGLATRVKDENIENLKIVLEVRKNNFEI